MTTQSNGLLSHALMRTSSFDQKPANGGMPEIASAPMIIVIAVIGMSLRSAPIRRMSCSPSSPWITEPAPRKSRALKQAWVIMWKIAGT